MTDTFAHLAAALEGRYRLERELGAGGMATVYLAHDVRHDRKVAVKVLRPELSAILGAERFLQEIRTTANLQHPHILPLHDSGEASGSVFYVMPFVDGESLRDRLQREKQLPVDDAVRIAREVADALEYAHHKGIVHRDIKPENILLHGGHALVADFGIALAASRSEGGTRMTETGMSLGTPHYMAPEQAMGEREITPKADIYALGCVLYEMLTAEPPFQGATAQAIIARVMTEEPRSLTLQRKMVPVHVEAAVRMALQKLPADRFASAAEFAAALGDPTYAARVTLGAPGADAPIARSPDRRIAFLPWALLLLVAAAGLWGSFRPRSAEPRPVIAFTLELGSVVIDLGGSPLALSPDGSKLVYASQTPEDPQVRIYVRSLDQPASVVLGTTENTVQPFFSPDGSWVAFWSNGALRKVSVAGGTVITLTAASGGFQGGTWGSRGEIVYASNGALVRVSQNGGTADTLLKDSTAQYRWPEFLPDGKTVLVTTAGSGPARIQALSLSSRKLQDLDLPGVNPRYVGRNHLVFATPEGVLQSVAFDPDRVRVLGPVTLVATDVRVGLGGTAKAANSRNGILAWMGGSAARRELVFVDREGKMQPAGPPPDLYEGPRFSPDGRRVAVGIGDLLGGRPDIWALDLVQGTLSRVTFDSSSVYPEWSGDGAWVHYATSRRGDYDLWRSRSDGSGVQESLYVAPNDQWEGVPTPDGRGLVFRVTDPVTRRDIWWLPTGGGKPVPVMATPFEERGIAISPDGHWLAYSSNETGTDEVYVRPLPGPGGRVQISVAGAREPRWGPGGRELLYRARDSVYSAEISLAGGRVEVGRRRALFKDIFRTGGSGNHAGWDVDPSGKRFVFVYQPGIASERDIHVLLNWFDQPRAAVSSGHD
jgi:eukaryotic-like serine/threonine-protein kinase